MKMFMFHLIERQNHAVQWLVRTLQECPHTLVKRNFMIVMI